MDNEKIEGNTQKGTFNLRRQILADSVKPDFDNLLSLADNYLTEQQKKPDEPSTASILQKRIGRRGFLGLLGLLGLGTAAGAAVGIATNNNKASKPLSTPAAPAQEILPAREILPTKELLRFNPAEYFGIRNDNPEFMTQAKDLGCTFVRINGGKGELLTEDDPKRGLKKGDLAFDETQEALKRAQALGLKILYQYNPQSLIDREQIKQNLTPVITDNGNIMVELGNEPDDKQINYWTNRDLKTFAQFIARTVKVIDEIDQDISAKAKREHHTKIVVGALVEQERTEEMLSYLKEQLTYLQQNEGFKFDISNLIFAIHSYNNLEGIDHQAAVVRVALNKIFGQEKGEKAGIMFTELGVNDCSESTWLLAKMYERARQHSKNQPVFIHELPNTEGFGLVDPTTGKQLEAFDEFGRLVASVEKSLAKASSQKTRN